MNIQEEKKLTISFWHLQEFIKQNLGGCVNFGSPALEFVSNIDL